MLPTQQTWFRIHGMITRPTDTLENDAIPAPPQSVVLQEHLIPILIISVVVSLLTGIAFSGHGPATMVAIVLLRTFVDAAMIFAAAHLIPIIARATGAPTVSKEQSFALCCLAATAYVLSQSIMAISAFAFMLSLAGLIVSVRTFWIGARVVAGLSGAHRVRVIGMVFLSMMVIGTLLTSMLLPVMENLGMIDTSPLDQTRQG